MERMLKRIVDKWLAVNLPYQWHIYVEYRSPWQSQWRNTDIHVHYYIKLRWILPFDDKRFEGGHRNIKYFSDADEMGVMLKRFWGNDKFEKGYLTNIIHEKLENVFEDILNIHRNNLWVLHNKDDDYYISKISKYIIKGGVV